MAFTSRGESVFKMADDHVKIPPYIPLALMGCFGHLTRAHLLGGYSVRASFLNVYIGPLHDVVSCLFSYAKMMFCLDSGKLRLVIKLILLI